MNIEYVLFSIFSALAIVAGLGVVVVRDPVKGALSLVGCFFSLACLYLLQAAEMIAVLEVLIYAGAIMVLFVFVLMLVENKQAPVLGPGVINQVMAAVKVFAVVLVTLNMVIVVYGAQFAGGASRLPPGFGSPKMIGQAFFASYLFQFELTSVLLLAAIVGAVVISRQAAITGEEP